MGQPLLQGLNENGFLFQEKCAEMIGHQKSAWSVRAREYPVSYLAFGAMASTKIDLVLQNNSSPTIYSVVECKRANPEFIAWLFGSARWSDVVQCSFLTLECSESHSWEPIKINRHFEKRPFHRGTWCVGAGAWAEVRKDAKRGSGRHSTPQTIEDALRQVLTGIEGLALEHEKQRKKPQSVFKTLFLPVVITTASLYVAEYGIQDIAIETGTILSDKVRFGPEGEPAKEVGWVLVDYGAGEEIVQESIPATFHGVDPFDLQPHKNRQVFIVNSKHIPEFFSDE